MAPARRSEGDGEEDAIILDERISPDTQGKGVDKRLAKYPCYRVPSFSRSSIKSFGVWLGDWEDLQKHMDWQADALVLNWEQLPKWIISAKKRKPLASSKTDSSVNGKSSWFGLRKKARTSVSNWDTDAEDSGSDNESDNGTLANSHLTADYESDSGFTSDGGGSEYRMPVGRRGRSADARRQGTPPEMLSPKSPMRKSATDMPRLSPNSRDSQDSGLDNRFLNPRSRASTGVGAGRSLSPRRPFDARSDSSSTSGHTLPRSAGGSRMSELSDSGVSVDHVVSIRGQDGLRLVIAAINMSQLDAKDVLKEVLGEIVQAKQTGSVFANMGVLLTNVIGSELKDAARRASNLVKRVARTAGYMVPVFVHAELNGANATSRAQRCQAYREMFDLCRDELNGFVFRDSAVLVDEESFPSQRYRVGTERQEFELLIKTLVDESTIRSDFACFDVTHYRSGLLPPAIDRFRLTWADERKFIPWLARDESYNNQSDLFPSPPKARDADIFEWTTGDPAVLELKDRVEQAWREECARSSGGGVVSVQASMAVLAQVKATVPAFQEAFELVNGEDDFRGSIYLKPTPPSGPHPFDFDRALRGTVDGTLTATRPGEGLAGQVELLHASCRALAVGNAVSCGYFGGPPCPRRTCVVAGIVFDAMCRLLERQLLSSFKTSTDVPPAAGAAEQTTPKFRKLVKALDSVRDGWPFTSDMLPGVRKTDFSTFVGAAARLRKDLEKDLVQVFLSSRASFIVHDEAEKEVPYSPVWGVGGTSMQFEDNVMVVFVSDNHPRPEEVVFNLYLQHRCGVNPSLAVVGESFIAAMLNDTTISPTHLPMPSRVAIEIQNSSPTDLAALQLFRDVRCDAVLRIDAEAPIRSYAWLIQRHVTDLSTYELTAKREYEAKVMDFVVNEFKATNAFESRLYMEIGRFLLLAQGRQKFQALIHFLDSMLKSEVAARLACLIFMSLWKVCRRLAWEELKVASKEKNPRFLPDSDQVAVALEMITTQRNLNYMFDKTSLELSRPLHDTLRNETIRLEERPDNVELEIEKDSSYRDVAKDFFNSFIFVYPVIVDIVLITVFGSGIFYTDRLTSTIQSHISIVLLISFPIVGAILNSVARSASLYIYSKAYPVFFEIVFQKLSMTLIIAALSSILLTVPFAVLSTLEGGWQAMLPELMLAPYAFFFILYMMLFGTLLIVRDPTRYFFLSEGPQSVLISVIFLCAAPLVTKYGLRKATSPQIFALYIGSLMIADFFLLQRLSSISKGLLDWPKKISLPSENAIIALFERKHPKPAYFSESHPQYQERLRLWKRAAREYYAKKVQGSVQQRQFSLFRMRRGNDIVKDRALQWKLEKPLMDWYLPQQGITEPHRFGKEWDSTVSQAVTKLKAKYQAEKLNRGDVFFSIEGPAIIFGVLYFLFIFMDRWATLFATGSTILFSTASSTVEDQDFVSGIRLATLFILVGTGFLEIALLHIYASDMSGKNYRLKKGSAPSEIIIKYEKASRAIYVKELSLFLAELLVVFTLITLGGAKSMYGNSNIVIPYALASISYAGLLVALFHKLFIANEAALNTAMLIIFLGGVGGSTAMLFFTKSRILLLAVSAGSTWMFACVAIWLSWRDSVLRQREFRLSPNLNTSGFKRIGESSSDNSERERMELFMDLRQQRKLFHRIEPKSRFMWDVIGQVTSTPLNLNALERIAFPRLVEHMVEAVDRFRAGRVIVYVVPPELGTQLGRTMLAVASMIRETGTLEIFTAIPPGCPDEGSFVLEVLAHEYLECVQGYTHTDSISATHILFKRGGLSGGNGHNGLASATSLDVTSRSRTDVNRLHCNTEHAFAKNLHTFIADLLRRGGLPQGAAVLEAIESARRVVNPDQARRIVAAELALEIGTFAGEILAASKDTRAAARPPQHMMDAYGFDEDPSAGVKIMSSFRIPLLLVFLALIADSRFGRELAAARMSFVSRHLLATIYGASSLIALQLKKFLLYRRLAGINTLEKRLRGLQRVFYFSKPRWWYGGNVTTVQRINFFDFRNRNAFSVRVPSTKSSLTCMSRYKGQKPLDWKPGPKDKPHSQAFFDATNRLIWEQFSSGYTAIYEYASKQAIYPEKRIMLAGAFDTDYLKCEDLEQEPAWKETQHFVPDSSYVTNAKIRADRDGTPIEIFSTYHYSTGGVLHYVEYQSLEEDWNLVAHLSRGWRPDTGATPKFSYADFRMGETFYRIRFDYSHPQHVKMDCVQYDATGGEDTAPVPPFISIDPYRLLKRRPPVAYHLSNEFLTYKLDVKAVREWGRITHVEFYDEPYSTARSREELWAQWRLQQIPGAIARTLDLEVFLRNEPLLFRYFQKRDVGDFEGAIEQLQRNKEVLDVVVNVPDTPETRCSSMNVRMADLIELAAGGDSSLIASQVDHDNNVIKTVAVDSGTYPTGGGGVGSCRRDLVNFLERVRWTCLAELGTAEVPQREYQLEKHIDAIYYLIIWDLDYGNANENFRRTIPAPELELRRTRTSATVIRSVFVPLIQGLVRGIFDDNLVESKVEGYEAIFVNLYIFGQSHDWTRSWEHHRTIDAFVAAVLQTCSERDDESSLAVENPTLHEVGLAYSLITKLLLPLAAELPTFPNRRACFHLSHHGIQAITGVVAKAVSGTTLILWDHGILWRERLFALCDADTMPRFVQTVLAGLNRLIAWLVVQRADTVNPCTSIQNPMWEAHLGGGKFDDPDSHAATRLKISPVVNGMNVAKFKPNPSAELMAPTAVMLSHVSPVKDVANAIYAAAHIVNVIGWKNFQLHVYGSTEKDPAYTTLCTSLISSNNLQSNVFLKGLGSPGVVLPTGWVFVNSSITEGLPLALGEAGLCGLPVVCTDVGGSREVISDLATGVCYGAIVPPSRPRQLAEAIVKVLAMTDGLSTLVPSSAIPDVRLSDLLARGPSGLAEINARATLDATKYARRNLGLLLRERTIQTFSIAKYWRVHEQMLYLGTAYVPPVEYVRRGTLVRKGTQQRKKFYGRLYEQQTPNNNRNSVGSL
ncbi:hypothetical protein HDU93_000035 [Gonapodya sp. JEL0774]|nr:hypothetical protein HDU93_000035 [Gonapodya sp. JEL0774]